MESFKRNSCFNDIYIQPAAGDAGGALGAALAAHHIYFNQTRSIEQQQTDGMKGAFLGPIASEKQILELIDQYQTKYRKLNYEDLYKEVAELLDQGKVVGWVQGQMEFGPRALGARSILADPRNPEMQKKLNLKIKYRESFRPFAPSVLAEDVSEYFDLECPSPYMLFVQPVRQKHCNKLPADYGQWMIKEKLYFQRSKLPAITHIDYSSRIQTVHKETNLHYWNLISAFKSLTGCAILVNTSFNVRGEPIVCTAEDSYKCFMRTEMDVLVIGQYIFLKKEQTKWDNQDNWKEEFYFRLNSMKYTKSILAF